MNADQPLAKEINDEEHFLRSMIAAPENPEPRLAYAKWLHDEGDPRSELLKSDWDVPRISFVDWIGGAGDLDYYLGKHPDLRIQLNEYKENQSWRTKLRDLHPEPSREWIAIIDTLGRPSKTFLFWNNTGPRSYQMGQLPFLQQIATRGSVVTFASAFRGDSAWRPGLAEDLAFLCQLQLSDCEYGSSSCPVHPFVCELEAEGRPLTGADVLSALKVADFRSQHISTLNASPIPYPGCHPGTDNDEIHNDPKNQCIFPRPGDVSEMDDEEGGSAARQRTHDSLRDAVLDGRLWYVLLHSRANLPDNGWY